MTEPMIWWVIAGCVTAAELLTGTFYLLMVAIGLAAGALSAHSGFGPAGQMVSAALVGGGSVVALTFFTKKQRLQGATNVSQSESLDIGAEVHVAQWSAEGVASVSYRGAQWQAVLRPGALSTTGMHRVYGLVGSRLLVEKI